MGLHDTYYGREAFGGVIAGQASTQTKETTNDMEDQNNRSVRPDGLDIRPGLVHQQPPVLCGRGEVAEQADIAGNAWRRNATGPASTARPTNSVQ